MNSSQHVTTPTSSSRPSLDVPHSAAGSPNAANAASGAATSKRANRAALREYYNIKKTSPGTTPTLEVTDAPGSPLSPSGSIGGFFGGGEAGSGPLSELDSPTFNAEEFAQKALATSGLAELLTLQARVLGEMRALDAERKALVYDNYSKLISATETIRRMRTNMDPLNPVAATLDPAVARIYEQASGMREAARMRGMRGADRPKDSEGAEDAETKRRIRTRELAVEVLGTPDRLRALVAGGKVDEARKEWELPRQLLETWKKKGLGGSDVDVCIQEGDAALRESDESSEDSGRNSSE